MRKFDTDADNIRKQIRTKNDEKKKVREGGNVRGTNVTYKDFMQKQNKEIDALDKKSKDLDKKLNVVQEERDALFEKKRTLEQSMIKGFKEEEEIVEEIKKLENRYQT